VVDLRDLRALLAVVRTGSFTAAAAELGYTQSAISQQVAALETELGHRLLERRPVRPTPAGERLAEHAARVLLRLDVARSELARLDPEPGEVRVAVCPLAATALLASALRELRTTNPALRVKVRTVDPAGAVSEVASGRADVVLVDGITAPDNPLALADAGLLSATALVESPLVVALPIGHPLQHRQTVDLDVLADAPWIVAPTGLAPRAATPALAYEGHDLPTLLDLVAAGHGAALLP
jgi:DNA-binding transcriptional LysR family regulator